MKNYEIVDLIARELGYNRFCGTIAAKNTSRKLNNKEECELADVLASNNVSLFREDALRLLLKIFDGMSNDKAMFLLGNNKIVLDIKSYVVEELKQYENPPGEKSESDWETRPGEEITNPIANLEV